MKDLEISSGNGLKIEIELEREQANVESKVEINCGQDQENHLTGSQAVQFIQQLLDAVKLQENMNKRRYRMRCSSILLLNRPRWKIKI